MRAIFLGEPTLYVGEADEKDVVAMFYWEEMSAAVFVHLSIS